jgi:hypothetical protein
MLDIREIGLGSFWRSTRVAFRRQFTLLSYAVCPPSLTLVSGLLEVLGPGAAFPYYRVGG